MQRMMEPTSVSQVETVHGSYSIPDTEKGTAELKPSLRTGQGRCTTRSITIKHPFLSRRSLQSRKQFFNWLLISTSLSLLLSTSAIACYRGYRRRELLSLGCKDSDTYDAGAPFAPFKTQRLWGAYSPYYSVEEYSPPPDDCRLTQVNIIQRHGARYPTFSFSARIAKALLKLQAAEHYTDPRLQFVVDYRYALGTDALLPFGEYQTYESGRKAFVRYDSLSSGQNLPFVRASGSDRVIKSAFKWIDGFSSASHNTLEPVLALIIPEIDGWNNTLDDKSCPNAGQSEKEVQKWQSIYAKPIADKLNAAAHGLPENLTAEDAESLIALCALETIAKEEYSQFCDLFSEEDFKGYEYSMDLEKFYYTGYGSPLGPVQGVGYINELLARLTDQPVQDHTQTNRTLDSKPETFPLGRGIYIDFSHDNLMVAVISAMGMTGNDIKAQSVIRPILDPTGYQENRGWYTSKFVPFSGRMVVERMECGLKARAAGRFGNASLEHGQLDGSGSVVYVRILIDDAVQDLGFCRGSKDGLCTLEDFVESQRYARENGQGDWEECFK